jgi:hypothetical protein
MKSYTFELPDDASHVRVSFELPMSARRSHADRGSAPSSSSAETTPVLGTDASDDDAAGDWVRDDHTFPGEEWSEADIRRIVAGSSRDRLQPFLHFLAEHPDQPFKTSEICAQIGLRPSGVAGMMSSISKRMRSRHLTYHSWFFDCRSGYDGSSEFEWRMRPREARIVLGWFEMQTVVSSTPDARSMATS